MIRKNLITFSCSILVIFLIIPSCKKGDEDPFISLRSRESRLKNIWKLQSASSVITEEFYGGTIITVSEEYDGAKAVITRTTPNETTINESYYSLEYEFKKHFVYDRKYIETDPMDATYYNEINEEGRWEFLSKSKSIDKKNKEQLVILPLWQYSAVEVVDTDFPYETWTLIKLSNDELKVEIEVENSTSISGYSYSKKAEYIFKSS